MSKKSKRRDEEELSDRKSGREVAAGRPVVSDVPGPTPNDKGNQPQSPLPVEGDLEEDLFERAVTLVLERGDMTDADLAPKLGVSLDETRKLLARMQAEQLVRGAISLEGGGPETRLYTALCTLEQRPQVEQRYKRAVEWMLVRGAATNYELATSQTVDLQVGDALLFRMRQEGLVGTPEVVGFGAGGNVVRFTAQTSLAEWRALRGLTPDGESGDGRQVREDPGQANAQASAPAATEEQGELELLAPSLRAAFVQMTAAASAARHEAVRAARVAAWRVIAADRGAWARLLADDPGVEADVVPSDPEDRLSLPDGDPPTLEQLQRWLDGVHAAVHGKAETPGSLGSIEANGEFAVRLRELLQALGLRLVDEKTGRPGMLFVRRATRAAHGQFLIQLTRPVEGTRAGKISAKLPRLILTDVGQE